MADRDVKIRRFQPSDVKEVQFAVAKAAMEPLAVANRRAYINPLMIAVWGAISGGIIEYMKMWPKPHVGILGYFAPLPVMAAVWVPLMVHRDEFEEGAKKAVHGPDMKDIGTHYSRSPSSGLWILEYGDIFVGVVAVDASRDSQSDAKLTTSKGTSQVATIRHFYIDEAYRPSGVQSDLINHAVRLAFEGYKDLKTIRALDNQLLPYVHRALVEAGFCFKATVRKNGVLGWKVNAMELERKDWERAQPEQKTFRI